MEKIECTDCGETKLTSQFHKCKRRKNGYQAKCKSCVKKYNELYRTKLNPTYWNSKDGYFSNKVNTDYILDYQRADKSCKIYRMDLPDGSVYIGATMAKMNVRLNQHLNDFIRAHIKQNLSKEKRRNYPLLHEEFKKYDLDKVKLIIRSAYIIDEFDGTRYEMLRKESAWIHRMIEQGENILNVKKDTKL